jgi:hypothetical protein
LVLNEIYQSGYFIDLTYSDIQGGWPGEGNIDADPLFVGGGDYHLAAGSPCINTGTGAGAPADDLDGDPRPQGVGYDMGADEYVGLTLDLTLNQSSFTTGQTLIAYAHITNGGAPTYINIQIWVDFPDGQRKILRNANYQLAAGWEKTVEVFRYTFKGNEPSGTYKIGSQIKDASTGISLATDTAPFIFTPR